jgi:hypothetical protein
MARPAACRPVPLAGRSILARARRSPRQVRTRYCRPARRCSRRPRVMRGTDCRRRHRRRWAMSLVRRVFPEARAPDDPECVQHPVLCLDRCRVRCRVRRGQPREEDWRVSKTVPPAAGRSVSSPTRRFAADPCRGHRGRPDRQEPLAARGVASHSRDEDARAWTLTLIRRPAVCLPRRLKTSACDPFRARGGYSSAKNVRVCWLRQNCPGKCPRCRAVNRDLRGRSAAAVALRTFASGVIRSFVLQVGSRSIRRGPATGDIQPVHRREETCRPCRTGVTPPRSAQAPEQLTRGSASPN